MTEYHVREALKTSRDIELSHGQLVTWRDLGLLEQYPNALWAPDTVHRTARVHELGKTVVSLARRVILLKGEEFHVQPPHLQRAMMVVASKITPHLRKMKRVDRAVNELSRATAPAVTRGGALPRGWRPPPREEWVPLILRTDADRFQTLAEAQYYYLGVLKALVPGEGEDRLSLIPDEELVTLLTIRHLATQEELTRRSSRTSTAS